jgi:hypothetical protein
MISIALVPLNLTVSEAYLTVSEANLATRLIVRIIICMYKYSININRRYVSLIVVYYIV